MEVYIFICLHAVAFGMPEYYWNPKDDGGFYFEDPVELANPYPYPHAWPYSVDPCASPFAAANCRDPMINEGLIEGDILIHPYLTLNAVLQNSQLWPDGVLYYEISPELKNEESLIRSAMDNIESNTCIRFVERTNEDDYISIYHGKGCFSYWGRTGGRQELSLGANCDVFSVIAHELMHAVGFEHEHNRPDRDDYITIIWDNIRKSDWANFNKLLPSKTRLLERFDKKSIMLYGSETFARDDGPSMIFKDGNLIPRVNTKTSISNLDIKKINKLYNCG